MKENFKDEKEKNETAAVQKAADDQLYELIKIGKKQLFYQKVTTSCIAGMLVVLIIAVGIMIPRVSTTLSHINSVAQKAEKSLENVDTMTTSVSTSAGNFDKLLNDNGEKLTSSIKSISEIDFEGLNKAISDLESAVGPIAKLFGKSN